MIYKFLAVIIALSCAVLVGCATNPDGRFQPGQYNYTPAFIWGETSASAIAVPGAPGQKGFAITCREAQHCLNRANDLCSPNLISIISSQSAGERSQAAVSAYGGGANRTTNTLMQIQCVAQ